MALTAEVLRSLIKHHGLGQSIQRTAKASAYRLRP